MRRFDEENTTQLANNMAQILADDRGATVKAIHYLTEKVGKATCGYAIGMSAVAEKALDSVEAR